MLQWKTSLGVMRQYPGTLKETDVICFLLILNPYTCVLVHELYFKLYCCINRKICDITLVHYCIQYSRQNIKKKNDEWNIIISFFSLSKVTVTLTLFIDYSIT